MGKMVHARLDGQTAALLEKVSRALGWTESQVIREGITRLGELCLPKKQRRIIGLGKFKSGVRNLGSNKSHLKGFGE